MCWRCNKPKKRGKRSWASTASIRRWKSPLPQEPFRFRCAARKTIPSRWRKPAPRSLCPLIKSSFGFALQDSCPYLAASDIVVADTTCDGKKKMYELLAAYKPVVLLQLPQIQDGDAKDYWRAQYAKLAARLEKDFGASITTDDLPGCRPADQPAPPEPSRMSLTLPSANRRP